MNSSFMLVAGLALAAAQLGQAQSVALSLPKTVEAGSAFSIQTAGSGQAALYIVGHVWVLYSVLAFTNFTSTMPHKTVFDPRAEAAFPKGMTVSSNRTPSWTEDFRWLMRWRSL